MDETLELARGLQNSNHEYVAKLAKAYLALSANYEELRHAYVKVTAQSVMMRHEKLMKRLAENGD